jgi:hypothetical protein
MATGTPGSTARQLPYQVVHTLRIKVNFNDAGIATGVGKQWLPKGAIITGTSVHVGTAFNAATTNVLTAGTNAGIYDNIVAAADVTEGSAPALTNAIKPTGTALGPLAADSRVFVMYTQSGTAATTGQATILIHYVPDTDL